MGKLTSADVAEIIRLYVDEGLKTPIIAARFQIAPRSVRYRLQQAKVFMAGRQHNHQLYSFNERAFDAPLSRDAAYWLGFLMADGALSRPPVNQLRLVLQARDRDHVAAFRSFLQAEHPIRDFINKDRPYAALTITSQRLNVALTEWGVTPCKSFTATPPAMLLNKADFWRGVVDGDGCLRWSGKYPRVSVLGSRAVVNGFFEYGRRLTPTTAAIRSVGRIYEVSFSGQHARVVLQALYASAPIALPRKAALAAAMWA